METIYIDRLFIINLICDYLIVLGAARAYLHLRSKSPHTLAEPSTIR